MDNILLFGRWDLSEIKVEDPSLVDYISLKPVILPKSYGRYAKDRFHKSQINIVERLINKLLVSGHKGKKHYQSSGHNTGKSINAAHVVYRTFEIIEKRTNLNPVLVYVKAVENSAPREEVTSIEYGGARYPRAVECSPQRRIDIALRFFVQGAYQKSFNSAKSIESALADEIINAYNMNTASAAISKKLELERQADASR